MADGACDHRLVFKVIAAEVSGGKHNGKHLFKDLEGKFAHGGVLFIA